MLDLKTKADLQQLVDEGLEESLTLDYKASPALTRDGKGPDELCKDVTALANSAGGQLVYGIEEDKVTKKPSRVDDGVADPKVTREWIEQILNSRVQPRMSGVTTTRIDLESGKFGYVISVPPTQTGPHQAPDQKYYRRFDLQSVPMYDYEIKDIMRRSTTPDLYLTLNTAEALQFDSAEDFSRPVTLNFSIGNRSNQPATYAIVTVGIDRLLQLESYGDYELQNLTRDADGDALTTMTVKITPPNWMPVFKEAMDALSETRLSVSFHQKSLSFGRFLVKSWIQSPGFVGRQYWELSALGGQLTVRELYPPNEN